MIIDASANSALLARTYNDDYELIEKKIANNNYQCRTTKLPSEKRVTGILKLDTLISLSSQVSTMFNK